MADSRQDEEHAAETEGTEDPARIIESVKNQTENDDKDLSPDGLVYNVSNLELEVERFLEVESWNSQHGIGFTDEVEEKIVEEMKAVQVAGDERRSKIKDGYVQSETSLKGAEQALEELTARLEQAAKDAEAASSVEASDALPDGAMPHLPVASAALSERSNPYTEYKALLSARSTSAASARSEGAASDAGSVFSEATGLDVDNAAVRSRIAKLRSESELLRECVKAGGKGDFSAFRKALMNKNS